jgi:hypothetical protein
MEVVDINKYIEAIEIKNYKGLFIVGAGRCRMQDTG